MGRSFNRRLASFIILPESVPTPANLRMRRAVRRLDEILTTSSSSGARPADSDDLLSVLLHARHEDGGRMTDRQLRDEAMTLFLAGHDTTALTLSWGWYLLAQNPPVYDALQAELAAVLGGRPPTPADLPRLPYTERVVLEIMRLYPAAYMMGRQAVAACELGGYRLPAGATVLMASGSCTATRAGSTSRSASTPTAGPTAWRSGCRSSPTSPSAAAAALCIGNTFAMMEACLVLATLAQRCRFTLVPGPPIRPAPAITLKPERGIHGRRPPHRSAGGRVTRYPHRIRLRGPWECEPLERRPPGARAAGSPAHDAALPLGRRRPDGFHRPRPLPPPLRLSRTNRRLGARLAHFRRRVRIARTSASTAPTSANCAGDGPFEFEMTRLLRRGTS